MTTVDYTIGDNILTVIQDAVYYNSTRMEFTTLSSDREFLIETGIAGYRQAVDAIRNMMLNSGMVINASEITGKLSCTDSLGITSYTVPFIGTFRFTIDKLMDPVLTNDIENPWTNGYRRTSYNYKISQDNVPIIDIIATGVREPKGPVKYYWTNWLISMIDYSYHEQKVINTHPFYCETPYVIVDDKGDKNYSLVDYKEITEEEYNLFNKLKTHNI